MCINLEELSGIVADDNLFIFIFREDEKLSKNIFKNVFCCSCDWGFKGSVIKDSVLIILHIFILLA